MRISLTVANDLVNTLTAKLNAGALVIYDGSPTASFPNALARVPFESPAFAPAQAGKAMADRLPEVEIAKSGTATWGQLVTASGEVIAGLTVRSTEDPDADDADVLLDRTDFQRGGKCTITRLTLTLPQG